MRTLDGDFLLIQKMRNGDEEALELFVRSYYEPIFRYCAAHIRDRFLAEDLAQETFERFFRSFEDYKHWGKAANYLYSIAANACRDAFRRKRELPLEDVPEPAGAPLEQLDAALSVRAELDRLPEELRETAILYFLQELKQKDIARILGIGLPLVKYRIKRARELLTARLREEE